jgi:hypothetical protein
MNANKEIISHEKIKKMTPIDWSLINTADAAENIHCTKKLNKN